MQNKQTKGFTLIELLVVIGIVAILSAVVILTLNPAELLKQSRDSNRLSDMATLKSALSLYLADVTTPVLASTTVNYNACYVSTPNDAGTRTASTTCGVFSGPFSSGNSSTTNANLRKVDATGWIPVNLTSISSGAPVGNLPVDPVNDATHFYAYAASSSLVFEIDVAQMESAKFGSAGTNVAGTDGGNSATVYEVGTAPGLAL